MDAYAKNIEAARSWGIQINQKLTHYIRTHTNAPKYMSNESLDHLHVCRCIQYHQLTIILLFLAAVTMQTMEQTSGIGMVRAAMIG